MSLKTRWAERGGYRQLLKMAVPLILSTGASSILHFIDRMFLAWYSPTSIAAALPAGVLNFAIICLFVGTVSYVSTFVAQYHGAKKPEKIGPSMWQGLYIALVGGAVLFAISFAASPIFRFFGHEAAIQEEEVLYFNILSKGSFFPIVAAAFAGFYSGRGKNWSIMWVNLAMALTNIALDYPFIFGKFGLPEMGIRGAAYATVIAGAVACVLYAILIFNKSNNGPYGTLAGWRIDRDLFGRMARYGIPSGVQYFVDVSGFAVFIILVGRAGAVELAATSITFNINSLAFLPMMGFGIAITVSVGQFQGEGRPELARRSVFSGAHLGFLYMIVVAATYILLPKLYIGLFALRADPEQFAPVREYVITMLRFVAVYTLFDTLVIVFASALKGAGDTRFVMVMILILSVFGLTLPTAIILLVLKAGVLTAWYVVSFYIILLGICFLIRFLGGKWKNMRVIEHPEPNIPLQYPEVPAVEGKP